MIVVLMGVAGAGKTTVGRVLAGRLGWPFHDADDFHPPANVEKMRRGAPLSDADRAPWLAALRALVEGLAREGRSAVLACSALRQSYRDALAAGGDVRFVHLVADERVLRARLATRAGHYAGPALLPSQIETLEPPADALRLDATLPPEELAARVERWLGLGPAAVAR